MDTNKDFDPLEQDGNNPYKFHTGLSNITDEAKVLQARADAFRDLADRWYMLWWNLPKMDKREIDRSMTDMFRMYMDLAPSLGVSRNGIPELRECCGRKRDKFHGDVEVDLTKSISGAQGVISPYRQEKLGWCPGDLIRRLTRLVGVGFCQKCDDRRKRINAFFRCGREG